MGEATVQRDIDLPPGIVREAFVDPDLVAGWLRSADALSEVEYTLQLRPGGLRGTWTVLTLRCQEAGVAEWEASLDRLEEVLRGHPTY